MKRPSTAEPCPCGRPLSHARCCGRYLDGAETPPDAESLMRSRYSAYVRRQRDWLLQTWHPSTRPADLALDETPAPRWLGLQVLEHRQQDDSHATVHFVARYKVGGRAHRLEETSRFLREGGCWYYVDGDIA